MIEHIRTYVGLGVPVFPVHYPQDGGTRCSCRDGQRCENIGKHPATSGGVLDATLDLDELVAVWDRAPWNIGLATGHTVDVLDIDSSDAIATLQAAVGMFADDDPPMVRTGKGWHVWYRSIGHGNRAGMVPSVDWRGKGGYVLAPPSLHASGRRYEFTGGSLETIPMPPERLCHLVTKQGEFAPAPRPVKAVSAGSLLERLEQPGTGAWSPAGLIETVQTAPEGQRNSLLYWAVCCVRDDAYDGKATKAQANEAMQDIERAALAAGLSQHEIDRTIGSAMKGEG